MSNVLIVDDDEDDRDLFSEALNQIDPSITCSMAKDGEEALRMLKLHRVRKPDMIFLDLNMPRINGIQCLKELKNDFALCNIPVVIYTTSKLKADKEITAKLGAVDFISKPTSFTILVSTLKTVLVAQDLRVE
jgi:CheY-like chemotaxis protein